MVKASSSAEPNVGTKVSAFSCRLASAGLPPEKCDTFDRRRAHSERRVAELRERLSRLPSITDYPGLGIYAAGSHARGDASEFSDIDLWFVHDDVTNTVEIDTPNIRSIGVMSFVIQEMRDLKFPEPSNDGEFLKILRVSEILGNLGGPQDDYKNHFTARMLLILESTPLFGNDVYDSAIEKIMESYMRDYEDHAANFRPTFLVNDILRYWKTLCLNYEHRRNKPEDASKLKQKIKNFKLGYSRLLTCFATIATLSSHNTVTKEQLIAICRATPVERLLDISESNNSVKTQVRSALSSYNWFLEKTEMSTDNLLAYFEQRENRVEAFGKAKEFGDQIFEIVKLVAEGAGTLRYLVV